MKLERYHVRSLIERVPLCGCGSSERMWEIVRDALARSKAITDAWHAGAKNVVGFYEPMGELPADAVEFVAHVLADRDFLEHGSSVQCAWLTRAGMALLLFLQKYGIDRDAWPEWAQGCDPSREKGSLSADEWRQWANGDRDDVATDDLP